MPGPVPMPVPMPGSALIPAPGRAPLSAVAGQGLWSIALDGVDPAHRALSARRTAPFRMVGLTWSDPRAVLDGTAQVRTRDRRTGIWSVWRTLDPDVRTPESGPDAIGTRAGTQPLWTGLSDGVQVRVAAGVRLPEGLRVELVDPAGSGTRPGARIAAPRRAGRPAVIPRSGWGADESLVLARPRYTAETKAVFVHHTAGTNRYSCAESADIIRSIFLYHVRGQRWNDIGYQFLVDKCGTVFEGRAGGIDKPVLGAHTYGFNADTTGIAVLGDYGAAASNPRILDALADVAAWKLGLRGHDPAGTVNLVAGADNGLYRRGQIVRMKRISGHRDGYPTECPGRNLYADLSRIRRLAAKKALLAKNALPAPSRGLAAKNTFPAPPR
nr:peptidoglycan recognition protein [Streptomyces sp. CBMA291]